MRRSLIVAVGVPAVAMTGAALLTLTVSDSDTDTCHPDEAARTIALQAEYETQAARQATLMSNLAGLQRDLDEDYDATARDQMAAVDESLRAQRPLVAAAYDALATWKAGHPGCT